MNSSSTYLLLVLTTVVHMYLAQSNLVPIKSHKVLTSGINSNQVQSIYDNNPDTIGAFYSNSDKNVTVEFDLGKNFLIQHVLIRMKREKKAHQISLSVGNFFGDQGNLPYMCQLFSESEGIYKCEPACRSNDKARAGIIARRFRMNLLIPSIWISVYEMQVFSSPMMMSDDISSNRLVLPLTCSSQSWLLTDKSIPANKSVPTTSATTIYFEKPYIVNELTVEMENIATKTLEIVLGSKDGKSNIIIINLSDCLAQNSLFTCTIKEKAFASRLMTITTSGLTKIFVKGKPVFYPQLKMKTSTNVKEKLQMSCEYSQCDLSVHSDCSPETIKTGVKFDCVNKRLLRMPSGSDLDSYVIVNRGKVDQVWQSTKFEVVSDTDERMEVSVPRSYQYFGQYKCSCIVADKFNTEISSDVTDLKESDFLEDLIFETLVQYKLSDSDDAVFRNTSNNVISIPKSTIETGFLPIKVTMHSLIAGNTITVKYPTNEKDFETTVVDRSLTHSVKAFNDISQSWSVATHRYVVDEIFPEFIHGSGISIACLSGAYKRQQNEFIRMLDEDKLKLKPFIWSTDDGAQFMKINIMYANEEEATLSLEEKTCLKTNTTILAKFSNGQCMTKDSRVNYSKYNNSILVTFKDVRNFAKKVVLDLKTSEKNVSIERFVVKSNLVLTQEDAMVKLRYKSMESNPKNINANIVKVTLEVISKKISDFISCGAVTATILIPGRNKQEMILQQSTFDIDVDMTSNTVNMNVILSIDNVQGTHEAKLQITDPTTFKASNVEFQEDQFLHLVWHGINDVTDDFLQFYEVKTQTTIVACNSTSEKIYPISKTLTSGAKNRYQAPMPVLSNKQLVDMTVSVQPLYKNNKRGQVVVVKKQFGAVGQTVLMLEDVILPTERAISIVPSQTEISCEIKAVEFTLTSSQVEKVQWKSVAVGNLKYKLTNLIPGRNYELTAKVIYKNGPSDEPSKTHNFETADDISVLKTKHVAQINERVNISCTVDIGPRDKFVKAVEWLRADKSVLPDGVRSVSSAQDSKVAYLIMEKALADYSGEYGCFAKPSASIGAAKITIVVNDLVVAPVDQQVDFSKPRSVIVICSASAMGKNNLVWIDPSGSVIPDKDSNEYSVVGMEADQNVFKSTLTIKNATLSTSGVYKCHKTVDNVKAVKEFVLYGHQQLNITALPLSSNIIGNKLKLRCSSKPGLRTQKVMWVTSELKSDSVTLVPNQLDQTTQDIEIVNSAAIRQLMCKLIPSLKEDEEPLTSTFKIALEPVIVVDGPSEVTEGISVQLTCVGYPVDKKMQLKWIYYSSKESTKGKVIKVSEDTPNSKLYDPIHLNLTLTEAKTNETGRYECKFKQETRTVGERLGKSISLIIKPAADVTVTKEPKKGAHATFVNYLLTMSLATIVLLSVTIDRRS